MRAETERDPEHVDLTTTGELRQETMLINMGPQHPSTHGVLRLLLELDGEEVVSCRPIIGYLHTGIEKNCEYRTWQQGVTYVTRADYLSPFFNELAYAGSASTRTSCRRTPSGSSATAASASWAPRMPCASA